VFEKEELAKIYESRGVEPELAMQVADQMMIHDALGAHARDEIGISPNGSAQPAFSSAGTFTVGAALLLCVAWALLDASQILAVAISSLFFLALFGVIAARAGGAPMITGAVRVTFWGALAMALAAGVGQLFGVVS